ncbi:hypothetical protein [Reyranella sp.]|uniref:hypothetical protein n=1 Tax=Reyranella sp. TaxID=1929291 RepID=UPI003D0A6FB9
MPQTTPEPAQPDERLAARICRLANAKGVTNADAAISELRRRFGLVAMNDALQVALDLGWLRRDGATYVVTPTGAGLGASRSGKRPRRVMPF